MFKFFGTTLFTLLLLQAPSVHADETPSVLSPLATMIKHINMGGAAFLAGRSTEDAFSPWVTPPNEASHEVRSQLEAASAASIESLGFGFDLMFFKSGESLYWLRTIVFGDELAPAFLYTRGIARGPDTPSVSIGQPLADFDGEQAGIFKDVAEALVGQLRGSDCESLPHVDVARWVERHKVPAEMGAKLGEAGANAQGSMKVVCSKMQSIDYDEVKLQIARMQFLAKNADGETIGVLHGGFGVAAAGSLGEGNDGKMGIMLGNYQPLR